MSKGIVVFGSASQHLYTPSTVWDSNEYKVLTLETKRFEDGEFWVKFPESIRKKDVFIIQSTSQPDSNMMELLIMIDAAKRASANSITAIIPYFGYARQDRKDQSRVAITASLVARLIEQAGATRVITIDLHTPQIQGFFNIPVDNLEASSLLMGKGFKGSNCIIIAPDVGREKDILRYAKISGNASGLLSKARTDNGVSHILSYGAVYNKDIILFDDMIVSGNTLKSACLLLKSHGARTISIAATHLVSNNAATVFDELLHQGIVDGSDIFVTNTVEISYGMSRKVVVKDISTLLSKTIERVIRGESVSELF